MPAVFEVLRAHGHIEPDALARRFHRRFERDPDRGYGSGTRLQLRALAAGDSWHTTAAQAFSGAGSMGNGAAMRAAPSALNCLPFPRPGPGTSGKIFRP